MAAEETKIIYHVDDEETPYLVKIPKPPDEVTLGDFKNVINRPNYKFFFKSMDDDFGVVKEEIVDDDASLPCFNGRVVSWVVPPDEGSNDGQSVHSGENGFSSSSANNVPCTNPVRNSSKDRNNDMTDAESVVSKRSSRSRSSRRYDSEDNRRGPRRGHRETRSEYDAQSMMSSDLEATSFIDSDEESQMSSATESSRFVGGRQRRRRRKQRMPRVERCSSFSTITESTMSLNIITVTLNMDKINFLGISIVGQANKKGDGGIYVGSVMKGGAVDADGRIEPGDMILAVGDVNFENMSNDDAVRVLRECVHKPGPITLTVAKCWDPSPKGYFTVPKNDVTRPIDPAAWLQHSEAVRATGGLGRTSGSPSMSTISSTSESLTSSIPEADRYLDHPDCDLGLSINTDMHTVVKVMSSTDSGLVVRDRMWLKVTIPHAFMGSDLVDWLFAHVDGFVDRRDARKYASKLLKVGLIRHAVNKISFSEQCYYVFGDLSNRMNNLSIQDIEGSEEDTLAPLASSSNQQPLGAWSGQPQPIYLQPGLVPMIPQHMIAASIASGSGDAPPTYAQVFSQETFPGQFPFFTTQTGQFVANPIHSSHMSGGSGSNNSGSLKSGTVKTVDPDQVTIRSSDSDRSHSSKGSKARDQRDNISLAEKTSIAYTTDIASLRNEPLQVCSAPGSVHSSQIFINQQYDLQHQSRELGSVPANLSASRQSFRMAMGNTSNEFFVDVM